MKGAMRVQTRKELHISPWKLVQILIKAGYAKGGYTPGVSVIETTEVNEGRTVIISWSEAEAKGEQE